MFNWIKGLFGGGTASRQVLELKALLVAPQGGPLRGEAEFEGWENGDWELEVEVEGPDGQPAPQGLSVLVDGVLLGELTARGDEAELKRSSRLGHEATVSPRVGSVIEVHGTQGLLLTGSFKPDR